VEFFAVLRAQGTALMPSHKTHRQHVEDAILGIKSLASHEERLEAYLLLNAEISARTLDAVEYVIDELEELADRGAGAPPIAPTDP
jgi:hypothetical protein